MLPGRGELAQATISDMERPADTKVLATVEAPPYLVVCDCCTGVSPVPNHFERAGKGECMALEVKQDLKCAAFPFPRQKHVLRSLQHDFKAAERHWKVHTVNNHITFTNVFQLPLSRSDWKS